MNTLLTFEIISGLFVLPFLFRNSIVPVETDVAEYLSFSTPVITMPAYEVLQTENSSSINSGFFKPD